MQSGVLIEGAEADDGIRVSGTEPTDIIGSPNRCGQRGLSAFAVAASQRKTRRSCQLFERLDGVAHCSDPLKRMVGGRTCEAEQRTLRPPTWLTLSPSGGKTGTGENALLLRHEGDNPKFFREVWRARDTSARPDHRARARGLS